MFKDTVDMLVFTLSQLLKSSVNSLAFASALVSQWFCLFPQFCSFWTLNFLLRLLQILLGNIQKDELKKNPKVLIKARLRNEINIIIVNQICQGGPHSYYPHYSEKTPDSLIEIILILISNFHWSWLCFKLKLSV